MTTGAPTQTFKKVWLTHEPPKMGLKPKRATGDLQVGPEGISFSAAKEQLTVPRERLRVHAAGRAGSDLVNKWLRVTYVDDSGAEHEIYLNDGRFLGWGESSAVRRGSSRQSAR